MKFTKKTLQLFACIAVALFITACSQAPKPRHRTCRSEARHARSRGGGRTLHALNERHPGQIQVVHLRDERAVRRQPNRRGEEGAALHSEGDGAATERTLLRDPWAGRHRSRSPLTTTAGPSR